MIPIKKWICMLVLIIIIATTTNNVYAQSFTANDNTILSTQIHDFFLNYFGDNNEFEYFAYNCNNRTCYYGIDKNDNYVNITYIDSGSFSYTTKVLTGVDHNYSVNGNLIYKHKENTSSYNFYLLSFAFVFGVMLLLFGGIRYAKNNYK